MRKKRISHLIMAVLMIISMFQILAVDHVDSHAAGYSLSGSAHIQTYADTAGKWDGKTLTLGTTGQAKRLESITINFTNNTGYDGSIEYRVHRQTYGWTGWVENGKPAGTTGQAKRLEAIQIRLTGELAEHYDVRYRVHAQTYGWAQGWQYNGALAGTTGEAKRLEALEVQILEKDADSVAAVSYRVHRQTYGWETQWAKNGSVSGTTGQAKRLEGITIAVSNSPYNGSIEYRTHVQSYGWMPWVANGEMSGTQGEYKRLEAIQIRLTGEMAEHYDVYYRVHAQSYGWLGWAKNGAEAGTSGYAKRLEAIQVILVDKGEEAPDKIDGVTSAEKTPYHDLDTESGGKPSTEAPSTEAPSSGGSGSTECNHTWRIVTEVTKVDEVGHWESVLVSPARDAKYKYDGVHICLKCLEDAYTAYIADAAANDDVVYTYEELRNIIGDDNMEWFRKQYNVYITSGSLTMRNAYTGNGDTPVKATESESDMNDNEIASHKLSHRNPDGTGGASSTTIPLYHVVHYDAVYENQWVVTTPGYDSIDTKWVCEKCGATKKYILGTGTEEEQANRKFVFKGYTDEELVEKKKEYGAK